MEPKIKHLEFIQDIIKRMAGNSFLLRGWSITLVATIITLFVSTSNVALKPNLILIALFLLIIFWLLDAYYLSQERAYICLYDEVRKGTLDTHFSLNAKGYLTGRNTWPASILSHVFLVFYGTALLILLLIASHYFGVSFYLK